MATLIGKGRKPKFELHLKIYDLNNVPLVSGTSFIKWHLPHSMHADHRGRTPKAAIANHRVEYSFNKVITGVRMSVDKSNSLNECLIEFEIVQEFALTEKISLGHIKLNLAEYVEESETFLREINALPSTRKRTNSSGSPTSANDLKLSDEVQRDAEEGIVRRYLMQDSKVNSTLKISILLIQVDGERSFIAPPLKTAPVFGGIAGFMAPEQNEDEVLGRKSIFLPSLRRHTVTHHPDADADADADTDTDADTNADTDLLPQLCQIYLRIEMLLRSKIYIVELSQLPGLGSPLNSIPMSASRTFSPVGTAGEQSTEAPPAQILKMTTMKRMAPSGPTNSAAWA
ncbi:uncharacterized protein TrAFT101_000512 [Trichoderma asperellum]|uniref:uncharacterized protein n=1 Tax=Trichoderma asperellum TaxID=101201 RepID=UPI003332A296|nr:hypothetical protein TrAFT101_000512 [Trichoderma asperellum]